jgi:hypothetical protein
VSLLHYESSVGIGIPAELEQCIGLGSVPARASAIPTGRPRTRGPTGQIVVALEQKLIAHPDESDLANG